MLSDQKAKAYCQEMMDETDNSPHGRYRSWWYCYQAFSNVFLGKAKADTDYLALCLAFYLASWGMYRGSSFLLQYDYKIHIKVVDYFLTGDTPKSLWISSQKDTPFYDNPKNVDMLIEACKEVRQCYPKRDKRPLATNTLVTKVLMGALGCAPAYDRYVVTSIKKEKLLNIRLKQRKPFDFVRESIGEISAFYFRKPSFYQGVKSKPSSFYYPPMKIMDMVLWRMSYKKKPKKRRKTKTKVKGKQKAHQSASKVLNKPSFSLPTP